MTLPKKIDPCPIYEAVAEIRFKAAVPGEAIFGILFNQLKENYGEIEKLPVMQLPEKVLSNDPQLTFQPHYRLSNKNFQIQIGPKVVSLIVNDPYPEWESFSTEIYSFYNQIRDSKIVETVERFALRYVNFFEGINIYNHIKLKVVQDSETTINDNMTFMTILEEGHFQSGLKVQNSTIIRRPSYKKDSLPPTQLRGSLIDINTAYNQTIPNFLDNP